MARTWPQYVRRYFPRATDEDVHYILLSRTSYPFGRRSRIKRDIQKFHRGIKLSKRTGIPLCDMCNNLSSGKKSYLCVGCEDRLKR